MATQLQIEIFALRYALSRNSPGSLIMKSYLEENWVEYTEYQRKQIIREIEQRTHEAEQFSESWVNINQWKDFLEEYKQTI